MALTVMLMAVDAIGYILQLYYRDSTVGDSYSSVKSLVDFSIILDISMRQPAKGISFHTNFNA